MKRSLFGFALVILSIPAWAQEVRLPHYLNFDGQLLDSSNNPISTASTVVFEIYDGSTTAYCLLYRETQSITPGSLGEFSAKIGPDAIGSTSSADDGDIAWPQIFSNAGQVRVHNSSFCNTGYTPAAGHGRRLRVTVNGVPLSPDYTIAPAPMASVAETLQGKQPGDFLAAAPSSGTSVLTGNMRVSQQVQMSNGANLVSLQAPTGLSASYNFTLPGSYGANGQVLSTDGTGTMTWINSVGGGITSLNGLTNAAQTLNAVTTGSLLPDWSSTGSIHTLRIPMAASAGVTAGLLSNTDYNLFYNKLGNAPSSVNNTHIAADLDASKITAGTLSAARIGTDSISSSHLLDGTIATIDISNGAVTNDKITDVGVDKITFGPGQYLQYTPGGTSCNNGQHLYWNNPMTRWECSIVSLPNSTGTAGYVMQTDGAGNLSWMNPTNVIMSGPNSFTVTNTGTGNSLVINDTASDTTPFVIDMNGVVGIGTSMPDPANLLHLVANTARLQIQSTMTGSSSRLLFSGNVPTYNQAVGDITFQNTSTSTNLASIKGSTTNISTSDGVLTFHTMNSGALLERMRINNVGQLGVGTTSPVADVDASLAGVMRIAPQAPGTTPFCSTERAGGIAITSTFMMCVCNGTNWVRAADGSTTCAF